jgi:hypothetical protein
MSEFSNRSFFEEKRRVDFSPPYSLLEDEALVELTDDANDS